MKHNGLFVDITTGSQRSDVTVSDDFSTSPDRPIHRPHLPPRSPYNNNAYYEYTALTTVLCFGTIALVIIFWKCCTKRSDKDTRATLQSVEVSPTVSCNCNELSSTPAPPPYNSHDYEMARYDKPPPYSILYPRNDLSQEGHNLPNYINGRTRGGQDTVNASQSAGGTERVLEVNIYDPKT